MDVQGFSDYLDSQVEREAIKATTAERYVDRVREFETWLDDDREPKPEDVREYVLHLERDRGVKNATIKTAFWAIRKYFQYQRRTDELSPVEAWQRENYTTGGSDVPDFLSREEVESLLETARERDPREYVIVKILFAFGIRVSELVTLRTDDVDLQGAQLTTQRRKRNERVLDTLPLTDADCEALRAYMDKREGYCYHREEPVKSEWLFPSMKYTERTDWHISTDTVRRILNDVAEEAPGVDPGDVHPHKGRHTVGSRLGEKGRSALEISRFLGQKDAGSAEQYTHLDRGQFEDMRDDVGE